MRPGHIAHAEQEYALVDTCMGFAAPEARLTQAVNQGNLAFLRNNLLDYRGYITYDLDEMARLRGDNDPTPLFRQKFDSNGVALAAVDDAYCAARAFLLDVKGDKRRHWQAIIDANRGNVAWARQCGNRGCAHGAAIQGYRQAIRASKTK